MSVRPLFHSLALVRAFLILSWLSTCFSSIRQLGTLRPGKMFKPRDATKSTCALGLNELVT